jgi:hypothetical protein
LATLAAIVASDEVAVPRDVRSQCVKDEVRSMLTRPEDFITGPLPLRRDSAARFTLGFTVRDGHYLSARWPGDAHRFASEFAAMIG